MGSLRHAVFRVALERPFARVGNLGTRTRI